MIADAQTIEIAFVEVQPEAAVICQMREVLAAQLIGAATTEAAW